MQSLYSDISAGLQTASDFLLGVGYGVIHTVIPEIPTFSFDTAGNIQYGGFRHPADLIFGELDADLANSTAFQVGNIFGIAVSYLSCCKPRIHANEREGILLVS